MKRTIEGIRNLLPEKPKVIEFGNQRYTADNEHETTKGFYESLGFEYLALDVNENMGAVIVDLNETGCLYRADLVTNNGTSEHIFNQAAVFQNAHDMSTGLMIHILPFTPWLNHGFYNYNPILFRDLAFANNYEIVLGAICNRVGEFIPLGPEGFVEKRPTVLEQNAMRLMSGGEVSNVFVFKKRNSEAFRFPFQGKYKRDIQNEELSRKYVA